MAKDTKAILKSTGQPITVYKSRLRNTWINSNDLKTEYKPEELNFNV